ncbi:MAG: signal peptidase I [Clostridia bacterium]
MKILRNIILFIILLLICNVLYQKFVIKKNLVDILGYSCLIVKSGSMQPTLKVNDMILIKKQNNYSSGDIVAYNVNNKYLVTHRIVGTNENQYITKGDINNTNDTSINKSQVEGKVIFRSAFFGFYILYLLKPSIIILMLLLIFIVVKRKESEEKSYEDS